MNLSLTITYNGRIVYSNAAATLSTFTNDAINLGNILSLEDSNGLVNLGVTMSETTASAGSGFYSGFIIGAPPLSQSQCAQSHAQDPRRPAHSAESILLAPEGLARRFIELSSCRCNKVCAEQVTTRIMLRARFN